MKHLKMFSLALSIAVVSMFSLASCENENSLTSDLAPRTEVGLRSNNSVVFAPSAHPYGKSHAAWAQEFWKVSMQLSCAESNILQVLELDNNVVTLSGPLGEFTENVTVSRHQSIFLPLVTTIVDYPCPPESEFEPAPGQSLEEFLQQVIVTYIDPVVNLHAELDGVSIGDLSAYRSLSDLFYFTGNTELIECYDPCVTGESQPAVTDGYFVMFKKMQPGTYVLTMHGEIPEYDNFEWNVTVNITVE